MRGKRGVRGSEARGGSYLISELRAGLVAAGVPPSTKWLQARNSCKFLSVSGCMRSTASEQLKALQAGASEKGCECPPFCLRPAVLRRHSADNSSTYRNRASRFRVAGTAASRAVRLRTVCDNSSLKISLYIRYPYGTWGSFCNSCAAPHPSVAESFLLQLRDK